MPIRPTCITYFGALVLYKLDYNLLNIKLILKYDFVALSRCVLPNTLFVLHIPIWLWLMLLPHQKPFLSNGGCIWYAITSNTRQRFCTEERTKQCFKFGLQTTMYMNYIAVRAVGGSYQCAQKHNFRTSAHSDTFTPALLLRSSYLHFKFIFSSTKCDRLITLYVVIRTCKYLA